MFFRPGDRLLSSNCQVEKNPSMSQIKRQISRQRGIGEEAEQATVTDTLSLSKEKKNNKTMLEHVPLRNSFQVSSGSKIQPRHAGVKGGPQGHSQVSLQTLPLHTILQII